MLTPSTLQGLAREYGTPLFVVDHQALRKNYAEFRKHLPRVQPYYAVKANSDPTIVETLYRAGAGFDVASLPELMLVRENIKDLPADERRAFIADKIIYANTIKDVGTLAELDVYDPLVTYDNYAEIDKIERHAPSARLILRIKVPNEGAVVELSSKFGVAPDEALPLIEAASRAGLTVEGISFHVGSQCTDFGSYVRALNLAAGVFEEARYHGYAQLTTLDIGGGFPVPYNDQVKPFRTLARTLNAELDRLFPRDIRIIAEPGRFMVATAGTLVASVIGKAVRDGNPCYYINDGVYHTFSGIIFDHIQYHLKAFADGPRQTCAVFGPTCDALDTISLAEELPELEMGDLVYSENIGAYTHASSTSFNGFPPTNVVHLYKREKRGRRRLGMMIENRSGGNEQRHEAGIRGSESLFGETESVSGANALVLSETN